MAVPGCRDRFHAILGLVTLGQAVELGVLAQERRDVGYRSDGRGHHGPPLARADLRRSPRRPRVTHTGVQRRRNRHDDPAVRLCLANPRATSPCLARNRRDRALPHSGGDFTFFDPSRRDPCGATGVDLAAGWRRHFPSDDRRIAGGYAPISRVRVRSSARDARQFGPSITSETKSGPGGWGKYTSPSIDC